MIQKGTVNIIETSVEVTWISYQIGQETNGNFTKEYLNVIHEVERWINNYQSEN